MGETATATTDEPLLGATINGRYRIISLIARGGMGKVFKAEQSALGRLCALKVLSPKYQGDKDPEFHRRFTLEAATASKLTHPNTVTIFDHGKCEQHDLYYIAMEYLDGRTLHDILHEEGAFIEVRANRIAQQICRSIAEAHSRGVVHRDLKPGNVMLLERDDEKDIVKVLDFGLVKDVSGEGEDLTQTGLFMGSPKYMSPEQITGGDVSSRTDLYALGVMLYEMLCGKVPFDKKVSMNTLMAHVNDTPPRMNDKNPDVFISDDMEHIVMRCLEKDPSKRFVSARDMLRHLKRAAGDITDTYEGMPAVKVDSNRISQRDLHAVGRTSDSKIIVPSPPPSGSGPQRAVSSPGLAETDSLAPPPAPPTFSGALEQPRPVYKTYVLAAVALALGGGLVFTLMKQRAPDVAGQAPVVTTVVQVVSASPAENPFGGIRSVRIDSEPPGAGVADRGVEVCHSTPCELVWKGEAAKAERKLTVFKHGFTSTTVTVSPTDDKVLAKLEVAPAGYTAPPIQTMTPGASAAPLADLPTAVPTSAQEPAAAPTPSAVAAVTAPTAVATAAPTQAPAAPAILPFGDGMTRPTLTSGGQPVWTREALAAKVGGTVLAKCIISASGSVSGCRIVKGVPHMDQAVINALQSSRYQPAMKDGKAVSVDYLITMKLVPP